MNKYVTQFLEDNISLVPKTDSSFHQLTLLSLVTSLKAKTILELGVRDGGTTLPLLVGAKLNNGKLYSVDLNTVDYRPPTELSQNWSLSDNIDALTFLKNWPKDKIIDFVYLDDWHAYSHVKQELEILDQLVSPKSLILIHDTMYGNWQPHYHCDLTLKDGQWEGGGPYRAICELNPQFWEFSTIPVSHGLTILRKKYSNKYNI
jgi:hypothetical protein